VDLGERYSGPALSRATGAKGAVTLVQRFGSALNLNIHFHMLYLDGVYLTDSTNWSVFRHVAAPGANALQELVEQIAARVGQVLERRGLIERDIENAWRAAGAEPGPLDDLIGHSITYRIAVGPRAGQKLFTLQTVPPRWQGLESDPNGAARAGGFSLHAGVDIAPHQRQKLERLCRYVSRPPVACERLALTASGDVRYTLKTPYHDGTTHIVLEPLDFIARLAALVPPPRMHLTLRCVSPPGAAARTPGGARLRQTGCRAPTWCRYVRSRQLPSCARLVRPGFRHSRGFCVIDDNTRQSVLFSDLLSKPVVAKFDQRHASSDGGAILLQACDRRLGLTEALIGGIDDRRQSGKIRHAIGDLLRQRLYAIACGYPDGNDASRLAADPIQKLLGGRDPVGGQQLASQPTLSRFTALMAEPGNLKILREAVLEFAGRGIRAAGSGPSGRESGCGRSPSTSTVRRSRSTGTSRRPSGTAITGRASTTR
jgi:hypothetical protein